MRIWLARIATFPAVVCALVVFRTYYFCIAQVANDDIFWHLRDAHFMVEKHRSPAVDMFSFTVAGMRWLDHAWLSELAYYGAFRALGWQGIFLLTVLLLALISCGVFYLCWVRSGKDPLAAALATILGTGLIGVGFGPRMHDFGWLCFIGIFVILEKFRSGSAPLWPIPILFCLWVNLHGSWPFGLIIFWIVFFSGLVQFDLERLKSNPWSPSQRKKLLFAGIASTAAVFVNPFGLKLLLYPADVALRQPLMVAIVPEWAPLKFASMAGDWFAVTVAMLLVLAMVRDVRWRIDDLILALVLFYLGFSHARMLFPAGIILPPILANGLGGLLSNYDPKVERVGLNATILAGVALGLVLLFPNEKKLGHVIADEYPSGAVDFLKAHGGSAHLLNEFDWGGYIGWVVPEQRIFIDSRSDIFEHHGVLRDYLDVMELNQPADVLKRYAIDSVLVRGDSPLAGWLSQQRQWRCTYEDATSALYLHNP